MRRASPPFHLLATATASNANTAIMYPNKPLRGRGRGRGFSGRPYSGSRGQFVTGDEHLRSVRDVNWGIRRGECGSFANPTPHQNPRFNPRPSPPYHQSPQFRRPPPYNHAQQFRHAPPSNQARQVRARPPDYRVWEYAATPPPPDCERFIILSYNILADYLAIAHWSQLYRHIPHYMLDWQWRKRNIVFELGLWSADIMCLQEVDRFQDFEEELKLRGYSGIWKMRTGNPVDGCAIFWRTSRFKLRYEECIEFNKLGLRDNVAQICVLELMHQNGPLPTSLTGSNKVVICNIHVLYNPKRGEIKLGQVRVLLDRAKAVSKLWDDAPVVICGDFNCTPKSPLYNFISDQKLNLSEIDRDKVSGQASAVRTPRPYGPNSRERSANGSVQVTSIAGNKEVNAELHIGLSDVQKSDNQDNKAENQHNQTALDMAAKSSPDAQSENESGASYDAEKVIQHNAVNNSIAIGEVDSIKEEPFASYSEGRFPVNHINTEIHGITPKTSLALETVCTDRAGKGCTEQISDAVSPANPETSSEKFNLDIPKENKHTESDTFSTSFREENQSFGVEIEISSVKPSCQMAVSDSIKIPHLAYEERPSFDLMSDDQISCTLTSDQVGKSCQSSNTDLPLDEKLERLSLDEMDKDIVEGENTGEDGDAFIFALHNTGEGFQPSIGTDLEKSDKSDELESTSDNLLLHAQSDIVDDDLPSSPESKSFDAERTTYNPSLWTPVEIETATGNPKCTFLEHSLPLRSTYIEVVDCSGTRDPNGEPLVTSYNRCFFVTVDYIWRSDGLQTFRVLAPIPKHAMEQTQGFPTKKWGSDHIALVSELAFVKRVTNVSGGLQ